MSAEAGTAAEARAWLAERLEAGEVSEHALECGDCSAPMRLVVVADGWPPSLFYGCSRYPDCRGTHGAHADGRPLGTPADAATREARKRAHAALDRLWRGSAAMYDLEGQPNVEVLRGRLERLARSRAYAWLADRMGLEPEECHVGLFDEVTCELVVMLVETTGPHAVRAWAKARRAEELAGRGDDPGDHPDPGEAGWSYTAQEG